MIELKLLNIIGSKVRVKKLSTLVEVFDRKPEYDDVVGVVEILPQVGGSLWLSVISPNLKPTFVTSKIVHIYAQDEKYFHLETRNTVYELEVLEQKIT